MVKVYTIASTPFVIGGSLRSPVATEVEEYERIVLRAGYSAIVVENPVKKLFHVFLEDCGALIGTGPSKKKLVASVKADTKDGDPEIMKKQVLQGRKDRDRARVLTVHEFFGWFDGERKELTKRGCSK
jgi:hypothetical protein